MSGLRARAPTGPMQLGPIARAQSMPTVRPHAQRPTKRSEEDRKDRRVPERSRYALAQRFECSDVCVGCGSSEGMGTQMHHPEPGS